jgi:hypothetical protein
MRSTMRNEDMFRQNFYDKVTVLRCHLGDKYGTFSHTTLVKFITGAYFLIITGTIFSHGLLVFQDPLHFQIGIFDHLGNLKVPLRVDIGIS